MKNRVAMLAMALMVVCVFAFVLVPMEHVYAETEYVIIEDNEIPMSDSVEEGNGSIALILAGISCVMTIGAAFLWLRSEKKRVVDDEE